MQKHPDADSFVLEHLRQPANATTRLVFADWLEDTGTPSNVAWAHYIRLREQVDRIAPDERGPLLRQAGTFAAKVRAKLSLAARVFARTPESVLQLIPMPNVTVRLADHTPPRAILELMPESVVRENLVLPLTLRGNTLFGATTGPHNFDTAQKLMFILNQEIVLVGAERSDIQEAINRGYGQTETETIDSVLVEFAEFETNPGVHPVNSGSDFLDDVFRVGNRRGRELITFIPQTEIVRIYFGGTEAGRISRADWLSLVFPEIMRRGEASGTELTVEVMRNGSERAVRIWNFPFSLL